TAAPNRTMPLAASSRAKARTGSSAMRWKSGGGCRCPDSAMTPGPYRLGRLPERLWADALSAAAGPPPSRARSARAHDRSTVPAIGRVRLGVVSGGDRVLLAVADGVHPRPLHAELHQVLAGHLGTTLAERQVVLDRPQLVAVPGNADSGRGVRLHRLGQGLELLPVLLGQLRLVELEVGDGPGEDSLQLRGIVGLVLVGRVRHRRSRL